MELKERIKNLNKSGVSTKLIATKGNIKTSVIYSFTSGRAILPENEEKIEKAVQELERVIYD